MCWDICEDVTDKVMAELREAQIRDFMAAGNPKEDFNLSDVLNFQDLNYTPSPNSNGVVNVPVISNNNSPNQLTTINQTENFKKEFIIRKLNQKKGGIKIKAESLQEILQFGKIEFKKDVICVREEEDNDFFKIIDFFYIKRKIKTISNNSRRGERVRKGIIN